MATLYRGTSAMSRRSHENALPYSGLVRSKMRIPLLLSRASATAEFREQLLPVALRKPLEFWIVLRERVFLGDHFLDIGLSPRGVRMGREYLPLLIATAGRHEHLHHIRRGHRVVPGFGHVLQRLLIGFALLIAAEFQQIPLSTQTDNQRND